MIEERRAQVKHFQELGKKHLSNDKFAALFEEGCDTLKNRSEYNEINNMFLLYGYNPDTDEWITMPVVFGDWPPPETIDGVAFGKKGCLEGVGMMFADKFPDHVLVDVVHISEAWMVERPHDEPMEDMDLRPSESPDRVECGIVAGVSVDKRNSFRTYKLLRKDGEFAGWELHTESLHNPFKPSEHPVEDNLVIYIYIGFMKVKFKQGAANGKTND